MSVLYFGLYLCVSVCACCITTCTSHTLNVSVVFVHALSLSLFAPPLYLNLSISSLSVSFFLSLARSRARPLSDDCITSSQMEGENGCISKRMGTVHRQKTSIETLPWFWQRQAASAAILTAPAQEVSHDVDSVITFIVCMITKRTHT
jgi:hypothetical protein